MLDSGDRAKEVTQIALGRKGCDEKTNSFHIAAGTCTMVRQPFAIERLDVAILPRTPGFDEERAHPQLI